MTLARLLDPTELDSTEFILPLVDVEKLSTVYYTRRERLIKTLPLNLLPFDLLVPKSSRACIDAIEQGPSVE